MAQTPDSAEELLSEQQEKLRELTTQSWNLELVVSGVIMFAILQVPDLLSSAFDYIQYNQISQTTTLMQTLPLLAMSSLKVSCYVLFLAFLTNFVMRAYWVSLVGLLAVYPSGIQYERLPFSTPYSQSRMRSEMGSLERYILQLDRRCNIVFAVAFLFIFQLILIALSYLSLIIIYSLLQPFISGQYWQIIKYIGYALFGFYLLAYIVLSLPQVKANPTMAQLHYRFSTLGKLISWGLYKPILFIINTFFSHIPKQKLLKNLTLLYGAMMLLIIVGFTAELTRQNRRLSVLTQRHLYTARTDSLFINPNMYDSQRAEDAYISEASIQSDVIQEPFLRLYIAYPKALDTLLTRFAPEPTWPASLSRAEKRTQFANWSSQQLNRLLRLRINDSLYSSPNLLFTERGTHQQRGWQTVLVPSNLKAGRNTLRLGIQPDSSRKEERITTIPFWYVPGK